MAVVDQHRPCVGMLETFSRFSGRFRSVSARVSGFNVTDGNTDSRGGVGVIDYAPRQGYNISVKQPISVERSWGDASRHL